MMTRRITRTLGQVAAFASLIFFVIFLVDSRYRVLPDSIHDHLPSHHPGSVITDVTISFCSSLNPLSTCRLDSDKWNRIEKDLFLQAGWINSAYVHVERKKEEELLPEDKVVTGIRISRLDPGVGEKDQTNERWESRPGGLWILRSSNRHESDSERAVTAIDVLFGADAVDPRPGWELAQNPLLVDAPEASRAPRLSVRRGQPKTKHPDVTLHVRKDGTFKILQISDAHLSTGTGQCRDAITVGDKPVQNCEADPRTLEFIESILDDEMPDLVILSGDQVEGPAAPDTQTALFKMTAPLIERSIPYAAIFGNHDDEGSRSLPRAAQMSLMQTLPFGLSEPGPAEVEGVGNYYVEVLAPSPSTHSAITIYLLDTHGLTPDEKNFRGYDWLKQNQIDWFRSTAKGLRAAHSKYSHIHMALAFIHIPLPEYGLSENAVVGGKFREAVTAPGFNSHFYDALSEEGVLAVGCGHDHVNDYCALRPPVAKPPVAKNEHSSGTSPHPPKKPHRGPWMCYAGGSGFGGYAGYGGFHRRVRVWEVDTNAGSVSTWKRVECCGDDTKRHIDEVALVQAGTIVSPEGA